jgi:hypothetical protein
MIEIEALGRDGTPFRMPVQRQDRPFETVKSPVTLLRRTIEDPHVQFLEIGFRAPRYLNAVCHACGAAEQTLGAPASCDPPSRQPRLAESLRSLLRGRATPGTPLRPAPLM